MNSAQSKTAGFTLIELMIVMSIVALLMGMVGPLAINSLEKAQAKQEMLTIKNWLRKISYRAYSTGQVHVLKLTGKKAELYVQANDQQLITSQPLESLFFQPQVLIYNTKGFVSSDVLKGTYRGKPLTLDLKYWVNGERELLPMP